MKATALVILALCGPAPPHAAPGRTPRGPAVLAAEQLAAAFHDNEVYAEDRFEGRRLAVRGRVFFVQRAADGPCVEIDCGAPEGARLLLVCTGYRPREAATLRAGDWVTVAGTFHKPWYRQFHMTGCRILGRSAPAVRRVPGKRGKHG